MNIELRPVAGLRVLVLLLLCSLTITAQRPTSLRGQVADQFGAVVLGATVTITDSNGKQQTVLTDNNGAYRFDSLAAGAYNLSAQQKGFAPQALSGANLSSGVNTHNFQLAVTIEEQRVTVDDMRALSTDPSSNKTARVISGKDLNALSDDPNELAAQLDALAGPAAGPSGTQGFVDGFTAAQRRPPKKTAPESFPKQKTISAKVEKNRDRQTSKFTPTG